MNKVLQDFTGKQRLGIFLALIWVFLIGAGAADSYNFNWSFFIAAGVFPVAFISGVIWVVAGFRKN